MDLLFSYASSFNWTQIIKVILVTLLVTISISMVISALPKGFLTSKLTKKNPDPNRPQFNISESNKKRLDILFENMGEEHFKKDEKSLLLWKSIHRILKDVNYETAHLKKLISKKKTLKKNPEIFFLTQNIENLEKIILKYETLPSLTIINGSTSSQKVEKHMRRPNLRLI